MATRSRVRLLALGIVIGVLLVPRLSSSHNVPGLHNRLHAVHWAFCGRQTKHPCALGYQAVRVAKCESGWSLAVHAHSSGGHLGMFQFGSFARATYGFGWNPWAQSAAAYRYWRHAGWSPWSCRP
jgi:hypothetical protein